jgi:hypothetical protein
VSSHQSGKSSKQQVIKVASHQSVKSSKQQVIKAASHQIYMPKYAASPRKQPPFVLLRMTDKTKINDEDGPKNML